MWALALWLGCTTECGGPACASAWPAGRLVVAGVDQLERDTPLLGLPNRLEGTLADGAGWEVAVSDGRIALGMPDRSAVAWVTAPEGAVALADATLARWDRPLAEEAGRAVALVDTDGDGVDELWVGAPGADGDRGALLRYPLDATDGDGFTGRWTGGSPADRVGERLFACGDVTGDGRADLALGIPSFAEPFGEPTWSPLDPPLPRLAGAVMLIASEALASRPDAAFPWELGPIWWGAERGAGVGLSVACREDVDGDGRADVWIGAPFAGPDDAGRVWLRSSKEALESGVLADDDPNARLPDPAVAGWFGASIEVLRRDAAELVVGAPGWDGGRGRVAVYPDPTGPLATWISSPGASPDHFGRSLAAGDLDGDGLPDLLVGAPDWREQRGQLEARTRYDAGHLWVWSGNERFRWAEGEIGLLADVEVRGTQPFLRIGRGVRTADLDGDGRDEILQPVRAPDPDDG